jgi:archaellum component FlaC
MLAVYKEVLETSKDAVASSHEMLERIVTWTTVLFGILTAAGVGALWLAWKSVGEVQARANELRIEVESTKKFSEELKNSAKEQAKVLEEQSKESEKLSASLAQLEKELAGAKKQASLMLSDLKRIVPRLETLASVDTYAMRLFSTNSKVSQVARRTLVELSKDEDPVVRRECVRVFGALPDYPECFVDPQDPLIISRLREMALKDPKRGVQLEARRTLEKFGVALGEGA